jgi:hypothetical protein
MAGREEARNKPAWPRFLQGESAEVIAWRFAESDPLELGPRSAVRLRERGILLEPDRVHHRVIAVCARAAMSEPPPDDLQAWVLAKIDVAIEQLVRADAEAERAHPEVVSEEDGQFPLLTDCLVIEPELVRAATAAFNALDDPARRSFFDLMVEGKPVSDVVEAGPWDRDQLYEAIRRAMATLGLDAKRKGGDDRGRKRGQ